MKTRRTYHPNERLAGHYVNGIHRIQIVARALLLGVLVAQSAIAFIYPLQPESVREAYFLGRSTDGEKLAKFLGQVVGRPEDFWREFQFRVVQEHSIEPKKVSGRSIYRRRGGLGGAEVLLEFDAEQFTSGTAKVEVTTPDHQTVEAEFDLDKLK